MTVAKLSVPMTSASLGGECDESCHEANPKIVLARHILLHSVEKLRTVIVGPRDHRTAHNIVHSQSPPSAPVGILKSEDSLVHPVGVESNPTACRPSSCEVVESFSTHGTDVVRPSIGGNYEDIPPESRLVLLPLGNGNTKVEGLAHRQPGFDPMAPREKARTDNSEPRREPQPHFEDGTVYRTLRPSYSVMTYSLASDNSYVYVCSLVAS